MHMILLDDQGVKIHANARKNLVPLFKDQFEEVSLYVIEKFMVAQNDFIFQTTTSLISWEEPLFSSSRILLIFQKGILNSCLSDRNLMVFEDIGY